MKVHFISIGGSVMHQLAIALKKKGYQVTGSDDEIFEPSRTNLQSEGLLPAIMGWDVNNITADLNAVILGMHARADNPEIKRATEAGIKIYSFPEYIYHESINKKRVVIGGSHGKTTTTAMVMHVLKYAQKQFDYLVGARLQGFEQSVNITDAPIIVCEGDEYPASAIERKPKFHFLYPHIAVLTGIAWDHINIFTTYENYLLQFAIFIERVAPGGILIYNDTDTALQQLVQQTRRANITYQPYGLPQYKINNGQVTANINEHKTELKVFGQHNLLNMQAAMYVCSQLGVNTQIFASAMEGFTGAARRLEKLAGSGHQNLFRDFAHAPSKVQASVNAVKQQFGDNKLIAVLELHTFSSLSKQFLPQYCGSLDMANEAVVFYSHHALQQKKLPPITDEQVVAGFNKKGLLVMSDKNKLEQWLLTQNMEQTNLLLMSSGTFDGMAIDKIVCQKFKQPV